MSQLANVSGWQRSLLANVFPLAEPARAPGLFSTAGAQLDGLSWLGGKYHRLANVLVGKCHRLANVSVGKCLGWQMTAGKCHGGQMTAGKCPRLAKDSLANDGEHLTGGKSRFTVWASISSEVIGVSRIHVCLKKERE